MAAEHETAERAAPAVYGWLREAWNTAADDALLEVLLNGRADSQRFAFDTLLARGREASLARLVGRFDELPEDLKREVAAAGERLSSATRAAVSDERFESRRSAIALVQTAGDCRQAYLLADALCQDDRRTRELAAAALVGVTASYLQRANETGPSSESIEAHLKDGEYLAAALQRAIAAWDLHHRTDVLAAAASLPGLMEASLLQKADEPRSKIAHALSELLTGPHDPRLAAFALAALTRSVLRPAAVRAISTCTEPRYFTALLDAAWLLADPEVCRGCGYVKRLAFIEAGLEPLIQLCDAGKDADAAVRSGLRLARAVRLIGASGLPADTKLGVYRSLLAGGAETPVPTANPLTAGRYAALWELMASEGQAADELLLCLVQWEDAFAPLARLALKKRRPQLDLPSQPSAVASRVAPAADDFERLWDTFDTLTAEQRLVAVHRLRDEPSRVDRILRGKLASQRAPDRVRALRIIRMLGRTDGFAEPILKLAHDAEPVVRSAAIAALGVLEGASAVRVARQALTDPDARVRANAIEALDALNAADRERSVSPLLRADDQRVRANAIKSLLGLHVREAAEALLGMLAHPQRAYRASALWVIERLQLSTLIERVERLALKDSDPGVRRRARRALDSMTGTAARHGRAGDTQPTHASPGLA